MYDSVLSILGIMTEENIEKKRTIIYMLTIFGKIKFLLQYCPGWFTSMPSAKREFPLDLHATYI